MRIIQITSADILPWEFVKNPKCSDDTLLTFIRINNTQIVLVCAYKKMMHSTATRCVVFICHIGEGLS